MNHQSFALSFPLACAVLSLSLACTSQNEAPQASALQELPPHHLPAPAPTSPTPEASEPPHENLTDKEAEEPTDPLLSADLLAYQENEVRNLTSHEIQNLNEQSIQSLYSLKRPVAVITTTGSKLARVPSIHRDLGEQLIRSIDQNPVVASYADSHYSQPGTEIGYCFGRATYVHLALLKLGVDRNSIRKVWLVGPMVAGNINWAFHVAVVVRVSEPGSSTDQWMVVDNVTGKLLEVRSWAANFIPYNSQFKNLRLYVTDPSKFSVSLGKYSRIQMGLDLSAKDDWYRHYFADLMAWFRGHDLSEVHLPSDLRL